LRLLVFSDDDKVEDYRNLSKGLEKFGVETFCLKSSEHCYFSKRKPFSVIPSPKIFSVIKHYNPDIILTDCPFNIPYMAKLTRRFVILHLRYDIWSETEVDKSKYPSLSSRLYTYYLSSSKEKSIKNSDIVLLNSKWLQGEFKNHMPDMRNEVLYVGINPNDWIPSPQLEIAEFKKKFNIQVPAVAGIFQLNQYKKVLGLLKFTEVIEKLQDINFYFAGSGPYASFVKDKKLPSNLYMLGNLNKKEVKLLLESCNIFVHPSGLDALPRSVKEASLLGKPIVASNIGGIPEIVIENETGYICELDDTAQWVKKIRYLLDNPNIANKLGTHARQYVFDTFDWDQLADTLVKTLTYINK
jgi:glycosyltransferase involved in cell wall biosynthesis